MDTRVTRRALSIVLAALLSLTVQHTALGQRGGATGGGAHVGGAHVGGAPVGGAHGGAGVAPGHQGGAVPGRPGGGFGRGYGGYPGWRGYSRGPLWGWGPGWGWGWGWPLGAYVAALPWYYSTFWWYGIPYYYVDGRYYVWDDDVGQYEQIEPSPELIEQSTGGSAGSMELFAYPKSGQSSAQQTRDKTECRRWASDQTGFDVTKPNATPVARQNYLRAEAACLEGRGYSVR
jgi:hypothetical protein